MSACTSNGALEESIVPNSGACNSWSHDGRYLSFWRYGGKTNPGTDIYIYDSVKDTVTVFCDDAGAQLASQFSPDGRWIAYASQENIQRNIYLQPFPPNGTKHQVTIDGGDAPHWWPDGKGLFFRNPNNRYYYEISIETEPAFKPGSPIKMFGGNYTNWAASTNYDYDSRNDRFLMIKNIGNPSLNQINVVVNWIEELKKNVPAEK